MTQTDAGRQGEQTTRRFLIAGGKRIYWRMDCQRTRGPRRSAFHFFDIDTESSRLGALLTPAAVTAVTLLQG